MATATHPTVPYPTICPVGELLSIKPPIHAPHPVPKACSALLALRNAPRRAGSGTVVSSDCMGTIRPDISTMKNGKNITSA